MQNEQKLSLIIIKYSLLSRALNLRMTDYDILDHFRYRGKDCLIAKFLRYIPPALYIKIKMQIIQRSKALKDGQKDGH